MTTKKAAVLWGITPRRVQVLCDKGMVKGAVKMDRTWIIPKDTLKPMDGRTKAAKKIKNREHRAQESDRKYY
ncbi:MAG: DNA-binding protein [Peptococcaceae bacterium]|nr:DNA-binding protein [Peptococcaceae bacterium]